MRLTPRAFASGTHVVFDAKQGNGTIRWSNGKVQRGFPAKPRNSTHEGCKWQTMWCGTHNKPWALWMFWGKKQGGQRTLLQKQRSGGGGQPRLRSKRPYIQKGRNRPRACAT